MIDAINVIDCCVTEITHDGNTVKLPNELIMFAADEIRSRYKADNNSLEEKVDKIKETLTLLMEQHTQYLEKDNEKTK